ncbi:SSRB protein, partial [Sula dactylatra]|nr:SSRB protein [Sula dactylatra]
SGVSRATVLRPLEAGYFNFTSATIACLAQEGRQVMVGFMSAPGRGGTPAWIVVNPSVCDLFGILSKSFSFQLDRAAFGSMTLPSIGTLLLWDLSERKYDTPKTKE